ncbi:MAG: biotin--[acetyl-CoA-carboxylase] ligase [Saprospiraceae bacterium]|jgi:BirA family biotin operon repressor/biotin-[acetyl-CoA-carboxylase] ligase|nr:biotin--[acetyl-CoA-carboxylase] ligase [Saprospiraceae bacterium]
MLEVNFSEFFKGKNIIYFKTLDSTQSYALELISKNKPNDKTAILTYNQSKGRGQLGAKWLSEPGENICLSVVVYPKYLNSDQQFLLSQMSALAVFKFIKEFTQADVKIKWPNDILVNEQKIAGILINNTLQGAKITSTVVGIGVNINQSVFADELPNAISLSALEGRKFDLKEMVISLYESFELFYEMLTSGNHQQIQSMYLNHLFGLNQRRSFTLANSTVIEGVIRGVQQDGRLIVEMSGAFKTFDIRELKTNL